MRMDANPVVKARKLAGLSREQLAVQSGLSYSTLYLAERGLVSPKTAKKIAPLLGTTAEELLGSST